MPAERTRIDAANESQARATAHSSIIDTARPQRDWRSQRAPIPAVRVFVLFCFFTLVPFLRDHSGELKVPKAAGTAAASHFSLVTVRLREMQTIARCSQNK